MDWTACEVVIVAKVDASHPVVVLSPLGRRSQLSLGCLGKAVLACLPPEHLASTLADLPLQRYTERTITGRRARERFFFQAEDGIRGVAVTGVQTCALPI